MSSNYRRVLPRQHPLKRQVSLVDSVSNSNLLVPRNYELAIRRPDRFKYADLQKQISVDQVFTVNRGSVRQKCIATRGNLQRGSAAKAAGIGTCKNGAYVTSSTQSQCASGTDANAFNVNLKIVPAIKKRVQLQKGHGDSKKDKPSSDRIRKTSKVADDRYNLKIILDQNIDGKDSFEIGSPESSDDSDNDSIHEAQTTREASKHETKVLNDRPTVQDTTTRLTSASSRRAQFRSSRAPDGSFSANIAFNLTGNLLSPTERRPPLMRAMSAPIRPHDDNSKSLLASKRKNRRRKISNQKATCIEQVTAASVIIQSKNSEVNEKATERSREKVNKKPATKDRTPIGCDVVTLVSLISSEGSDSEKEESLIVADSGRVRRPPLLRKSGKSVSFQEHEIESYPSISREYPHVIRRGSVAPLAARIRANRPPTAPPGSIFIRAFETSESKMSTALKSSSREDISTIITSQGNSKENIPDNEIVPLNDIEYPEYVRTSKERECWKLYQKMTSKGITVAYDTVLRGMLTPTELRLMQKQKELDDARKAKEEEEEVEAKNLD